MTRHFQAYITAYWINFSLLFTQFMMKQLWFECLMIFLINADHGSLSLLRPVGSFWHGGSPILLHCLENIAGLIGTALDWSFWSFLTNKSEFVSIETRSQSHFVSCGVPQGAVLGPLLFNLYCIWYHLGTLSVVREYYFVGMLMTLTCTLNCHFPLVPHFQSVWRR